MSKKDIFGDDINAEPQDFETMLNQSLSAGRRLKVGDVLTGEILSIGREQVFVATGTPTDGALPVAELTDKEGKRTHNVGDRIPVRVLRVREGEVLLRLEGAKGAAEGVDSLEDAFDMELPVEGKVLEVVKGGYRVSIGQVKAFCPVSQMDLRPGADPQSFVNQKFEFLITQYDDKARNIVVSRRKLLELAKAETEGEFMQSAKIGDIFPGTIQRLEKFGAFVTLDNGLDGLIPISELAWGRVQTPQDVVSIGQKVQVALVRSEELDGRLRLSFSLKQAGGEGDPWTKIQQNFPVGTKVNGTVEKKESYGLFVNLAPGISGLMPRSKWRDHVEGSHYETRKRGDVIAVMVDQIQFDEKKLTLAPPSDQDTGEWKSHAAATGAGGFGTLGDLLKGVQPAKPGRK